MSPAIRLGRFLRQAAPAVCLVAALAIPLLGRAQQTGLPQGASGTSVTVVGKVVEADGRTPVAAATVMLGSFGGRGGQPDEVLTDAEGRFFFSDVAPAKYPMSVAKPGYLSSAYGQFRPGGANLQLDLTTGHPAPVTLTIWRNAVLTGRVLDDAGEPLVDVAVRALRLEYTAGRRQIATTLKTRSDDRGVYRFSGAQPGRYTVALVATMTSEPSSYAAAIRLGGDLPHSFLQTMTAVGSAPLVSYPAITGLTASPEMLASSALGVASVPTADGAWLAYPTTFLPSAASLATATVVNVEASQVTTVPYLQVHLVRTFSVSGDVVAPDGPAPYYAVHLVPAEAADLPPFDTATAVTDASGHFTFYGVPSGAYVARVVKTPWPTVGRGLVVASRGGDSDAWISALGPGPVGAPPTEPVLSATVPVTVSDRPASGLVLTLQTGPRVAGRVQFIGATAPPDAQVLAALAVTLAPANGRAVQPVAAWPGRIDANGQFVIPSSWPSKYLLQATAPAGWTFDKALHDDHDLAAIPFDLSGDLDNVVLVYTDRTARLTGTVDRTGGENPASADVLVFPVDAAGWVDYGRESRRVSLTRVDATGSFSLAAPPPGDYYLVAVRDADLADWRDPAFLQKAAGVADHLTVNGESAATPVLHVRHVQ